MEQLEIDFNTRFNGSDYIPEFDQERLTGQIKRIYSLMIDGKWRTLNEIENTTSDPQASISAQLRHLRKERFGSHIIQKQRRGKPSDGLFEYKLLIRTLNHDRNSDKENKKK